MKIYGVAILACCFLAGRIIGEWLGKFFNFEGNIGGVGFGMLLLILMGDWLRKKKWINSESESGVHFWSSMYIPVVVAMSSIQNVGKALNGGWMVIFIGTVSTILGLLLVLLVTRVLSNKTSPKT